MTDNVYIHTPTGKITTLTPQEWERLLEVLQANKLTQLYSKLRQVR